MTKVTRTVNVQLAARESVLPEVVPVIARDEVVRVVVEPERADRGVDADDRVIDGEQSAPPVTEELIDGCALLLRDRALAGHGQVSQ